MGDGARAEVEFSDDPVDQSVVPGHLGRRSLLAGVAGAAVGVAAAGTLSASVEAATPASVFEPVSPSLRLADTRPAFGASGFTRVSSQAVRVAVAGQTVGSTTIPADAVAAVFTVVGINVHAGGNFVTVYPSRTARPNTSNVNMQFPGDVVNNLATVKLGNDGCAEFFHLHPAHLVVDLVGVYRPAGGATRAGRFEPLGGLGGSGPSAQRIFSPNIGGVPLDGQVIDVDVQGLVDEGLIDPDATAVVANLTVARTVGPGFLSAYPYGESRPETSTLNYSTGATRAANSFVRVGVDPTTGRRGFHIFVLRSARVFVDVSGFITGDEARFSTTAGQFVAITPTRLLDTRAASASMRGVGGGKRLWPHWNRGFTLPSNIASVAGAAAVNLTIVNSMAPGFLTLLPAQTPRFEVSNVNAYFGGQVAANHAVTPVSQSGLQVFSSHGASVVCDLVGYYQGSGVAATQAIPPDPPPPPVGPPYSMNAPRVGGLLEVRAGASSRAVVDTGRIWHWTGTGLVGQGRPIGTFGHRTDAGGPYRHIHFLAAGDRLTIDTVDQRRYTYEYVDRELTDSRFSKIVEAALRYDGEYLSLIACTVGFDSRKSGGIWEPTSSLYRIVVRMRLVGWEDISPTLL